METIKLDLIPGKKMPSLHASQYDDGREHGIDLFENGIAYKLDGTETLTINERKGDDCICSLDIENTFADTNHIEFASTEQMCAVWGNNICELVIAKGEKTIGTLNFILEIEQSPTEGGIESESEIKNLKRQVEAITEEVIGDDYYTKTQTDEAIATAIEGKADTTYVNTELAKKADKNDTYTKSQVDTALNGKANASDVYTKQATDALLNDKADVTDLPDMTQYYDKAYIATALSGKANVGTSYTKSEEDALLANKADKSDTYTKEQVDDIVYGILPDDTASGSVANFTTSLELPIKSLEVDVNAVQESGTPTPTTPLPISGWSKIRLVHCGKNLIDTAKSFQQSSNVVVIGQNNAYSNHELFLKKGTYSIRVNASVSASVYYHMGTTSTRVGATNTDLTFTLSEDEWVSFYVYTSQGVSVSNITDFWLELGSVATDYEPYAGNEYIINLGGTYYGGHFKQDKDGHRQFEVTHIAFDDWANKNVKLYGINAHGIANFYLDHFSQLTKANAGICNLLTKQTSLYSDTTEEGFLVNPSTQYIRLLSTRASTVDEFKTWATNNDLLIINELATPYTINLPDGEPIITLNGTNNIYADTGDTDVVFKCSVNDYVSAHSGGNLLGMGGVYLGGAKSGGGEEEPDKGEDTEKVKLDETKEEIKTIDDMKKLGGE